MRWGCKDIFKNWIEFIILHFIYMSAVAAVIYEKWKWKNIFFPNRVLKIFFFYHSWVMKSSDWYKPAFLLLKGWFCSRLTVRGFVAYYSTKAVNAYKHKLFKNFYYFFPVLCCNWDKCIAVTYSINICLVYTQKLLSKTPLEG